MQHVPIVIEHEANDTWSAWVAGLPGVDAAADSLAKVKRAITRGGRPRNAVQRPAR